MVLEQRPDRMCVEAYRIQKDAILEAMPTIGARSTLLEFPKCSLPRKRVGYGTWFITQDQATSTPRSLNK